MPTCPMRPTYLVNARNSRGKASMYRGMHMLDEAARSLREARYWRLRASGLTAREALKAL